MKLGLENINCELIKQTFSNQFHVVYSCRKKNTRGKRNSGGIMIFISRTICKHVTTVQNTDEDVIWLKVCKQLTNYQFDTYLCCTYISPRASCRHQGDDITKLQTIYNDIISYKMKGCVALLGDLNCRTGVKPDYITEDIDTPTHLILPVNIECTIDNVIEKNMLIVKDQITEDKVLNENGRELLKICQSNKLFIVNGRIGPDPDGRYTCHTSQGNSVVDYVIVGGDILSYATNFRISEESPISDHCNITVSLQVATCHDNRILDNVKHRKSNQISYKWEESNKETLRAINSLKNASAGWDQIPTFIAKRSTQHYLKPLTYLINKSIHQGICPDELKVAKVFPVYKSGNKTNISNYRPISVLSFFSKVFEKIVYNHVIDFIDTNNLLSKQQFGFRKNHSTNHAVITLIDRISAALDSGRAVVGCYIDLKKAFDTVNHRILINKLQLYGIRGHTLDWFRSYLQNRKQYIHIDDTNSNLGSISCGVPQGSILGPLLFILYINDISNISHLMHTILFADDTTILIESDNVSTALKLMNKELQKLNTWLTANKLSLNISKTHYMVFDRGKEKKDQDSLYLNKILIERVKFTKFLGVIIDEKLTWTHHISYIKNKISKGFGIILRARKFFNKSALLKLYNSFVLPYLIYCVEIWGNASEIHILPIITLQKKIVRAITFSPYLAHTEDLFCILKIFPFKKLVIHRIGIQMFKYHKGMVPKSVCELFTLNSSIHSYNTGNKDKIRSAYGKHKFMYRNFRFVSVHVWNYLASNIIINTSLADFKKKSKIFIMSNKFNLAFS